jgi:hypothetical protein
MTTIPFNFSDKEIGERRKMTATTIELRDNNSQFIPILPNELAEPLILIAKIKGFSGVDKYIIDLIQDDLVSIRDGGQGVSDIGEYIIKYLEKNEYLEKICPTTTDTDEKKKEGEEI